jgi:hypothetical protein
MLSAAAFSLSVACGSALAVPPNASICLLDKTSDAETVALTVSLHVCAPDSLVLFDSEAGAQALAAFSREWQPRQVTRVASVAQVWRLFAKAPKVVVSPPEPRGQLLQAACLAGVLRAPLMIADGNDTASLRRQLMEWQTEEVYAVGAASRFWKGLSIRTYRLHDEAAVQASYLRHAARHGRINALVVANPFDQAGARGCMSNLAPWITLQKCGVLLLTNEAGDNVRALAQGVLARPELKAVDALVLVGDLQAIPMERRTNPLAGTDQFIETEPLTPANGEPISFATGRIFHDDPAIVALMMARPYLWHYHPEASHQALVVSNPGGSLPLLETFSRSTALELKNRGFKVDAFFGDEANRADVRASLPKQTLFLWEGHHSTLIRDYEVHHWTEPLWPSLIFLQSCLALDRPKVQPFLERGAVGVLGSSSRTFSGSGGALSLSYFEALAYEKQSAGGALRHAKNFLLCFALLKEKRLGKDTKFTGANLRTALAFTLWGDPTIRVSLPTLPKVSLPPVTHELRGHSLVVSLPKEPHPKVATARYEAQILPDERLAGLLTKTAADHKKPLVPLIFREIHFSKATEGKVPRLHSRLPEANWVFTFDARRNTGYLLIRPRTKDAEQIRFTVRWEGSDTLPVGTDAASIYAR